MPILKDEIQILRVREQSNTSQIVVALGRRLGQFHVLAKGVRRWPKKGFEGGFDLLARGELLAYPRPDGQLWIFKEWDEHARPALGQSYRMLAAASYLCELTEALTRHTAGSEYESDAPADLATKALYDVLAAASGALAARVTHPGALVLGFALRALECEGLLIPLNVCHACGRKFVDRGRNAPVWITSNGLECKACKAKDDANAPLAGRGLWLGAEAHRALLFIQRTVKPTRLSAAAAEQLARAMALLVHGALERDLRTLPYAMKLVKGLAAERR